MNCPDFDEVLDVVVRKDPRYHKDAYHFLREALDYTQKAVTKANKGRVRHVSGQELLSGIRAFGLKEYGPMTHTLLAEWGIHKCSDFGELVFNLVDHGVLSKQETDSRADFASGYDFDDAFRKPFQPAKPAPAPPAKTPEPERT